MTPPDQRFLMISSVLTDLFVAALDSRHIPEAVAHSPTTEFKDAAARYLERTRRDTRVWCFTLYAYAEIPIGQTFNVLFDAASRRHVETPVILEHAIVLLGLFYPVSEIAHGHKHICVFDL